MKLNSITFKLLILIIGAFVTMSISVLYIANKQLIRIVDESQNALYTEKVEVILGNLHRTNERLKKTGLVEAYAEDFQDATLKDLRDTYYKYPDQLIYPFIIIP